MSSVSGKSDPVVRPIAVHDVVEALIQGLRDFQAAPFYGLAFGAFYALGGMLIVLSVVKLGMSYLAYPLAAGFALIGPFVAIGLYEVSRRLEAGQRPTLRDLVTTMRSRSEIGWMAFVTLFIFVIWMYQVRLLMALFLGLNVSFSRCGPLAAAVLAHGGFVPAAAGKRRGFRDRDDHERPRGRDESGPDDRLGRGHRRAARDLGAAVLPGLAGDATDARARELAPLSTAGGSAGGWIVIGAALLARRMPEKCPECGPVAALRRR
jgi:hypothetical protein